MKILFTVQNEGRGHMTQAISLNQILIRNGHSVVGVLTGKNQHRQLPEFFTSAFKLPVTQTPSPSFVFKNGRSVSILGTTKKMVKSFGEYRRSLDVLETLIAETQPDLIINCFEPLPGLLKLRRHCRVPVLAVGHQFLMHHPNNISTPGFHLQKRFMKRFVRITGHGATRMALSFGKEADLPEKRLYVAPPILRQQLFEQKPVNGDYLLIYLVNHGYAKDVIQWHQENPNVPIHCFYDKPGAPAEDIYDPNLTFHTLDGDKFLSYMAGCRAVVCTAGFESVAEANYLGKPLLCIPLEKHAEQAMNACEAQARGLGICDTHYNISRLLGCPPPNNREFKAWVDSGEERFLKILQVAKSQKPRCLN